MQTYGYADREQVIASINDCLRLAFDHTGEGIDFDSELVVPAAPEPDFDKYPKWLEGAPVSFKCEVGRILAKEDQPPGRQLRWADNVDGCTLTIELPDGTCKGPFLLSTSFRVDHFAQERRMKEINEMNRANRMNSTPTHPIPGAPPVPTPTTSQAPIHGWPQPSNPMTPQPPGFRHYMAGYGRWITQAAYEMQLSGEPPYAYASCNPVTYTDPAGRQVYGGAPGCPFPVPCTPAGNNAVAQFCYNCYFGSGHMNPTCIAQCDACASAYYRNCPNKPIHFPPFGGEHWVPTYGPNPVVRPFPCISQGPVPDCNKPSDLECQSKLTPGEGAMPVVAPCLNCCDQKPKSCVKQIATCESSCRSVAASLWIDWVSQFGPE